MWNRRKEEEDQQKDGGPGFFKNLERVATTLGLVALILFMVYLFVIGGK